MSDDSSTSAYPVLPLVTNALFPFQLMPVAVGRPRSVAAIEAAIASEDKTLLVALQRNEDTAQPKLAELYSVGTLAVVKRMQRTGDTIQVILQGGLRGRILREVSSDSYLRAEVTLLPEPDDSGTEVEALFAETANLARRAFELLQPEIQAALPQLTQAMQKPIRYLYLLGSIFSMGSETEQALLEASSQLEGLRVMHPFLLHQVQVLQLRQQIANQAQTEMTRQQREYFLRHQLEAIQKELGETSPAEAEVAQLRRRMDEAELPEHVRKEIEKELSRLERMSPAAADYQVSRTYIDLALDLPWNDATEDVLDLRHARQILDEDHFDLDDVKDRIIEQLAVMKMNPKAKAPILCFVGPPGVGKTSLGQSIARAMGRKFERMSLGGLHDEAELRGHRRTYVGSMPGRIIQAIRRSGVRNPMLMLDEIDKLSHDFRGDPASALMEILDPAQNFEFRDNYLDLPFDLSSVFFVTTANSLDPIPRPLLDRMEVLRLPGYSEEDKLQIARRYLLPRQLEQAGLTSDQLTVTDDAIMTVIRRYTREAGVRNLERMLGRIARKVTTRFAEDGAPQSKGSETASAASAKDLQLAGAVTINATDLPELVGPQKFSQEQARRNLRPGVATGLAWTEAGGEVLYVETVLLPKGRGFTMTGQIGRVMKESAHAARSYIRSQAEQLGLDVELIRNSAVHIHVPAGAVPKDGPSAGVAVATALASLYANEPVQSDTAMTGEITLSGLVLPVGGIREKVLAARRAEIRRVVIPQENEPDLRELPEHVRNDMEFVLVARIEDALNAAIPGLAPRLVEVNAQFA
jgi:ATP-dependent Lon protease